MGYGRKTNRRSSHRSTGACLVLLATVLAGCATAPAAATRMPGVDPIATQETVRIAVDDVAPGGEVGWGVFIENTSGANAIVDGYDLVDLSRGVDVLGAAAIPQLPPPGIGPETIVTDDVRSMVASRPLVGSTIGPTTTAGWTLGGIILVLLRPRNPGDVSASGIRLRYHIGAQAYETLLNSGIEICAAASLTSGGQCPLPSAPSS